VANRWLVGIVAAGILVTITIGGAYSYGVGVANAARPVERGERNAIAAAARTELRALATRPGSGIRQGTKVVLTPSCVSTVDRRYAVAAANPVERRVVGQSGLIFLRRTGDRFIVVGGFRSGDRYYRRPRAIPAGVFADLRRPGCTVPPRPRTILERMSRGQAPVFTV
jgi:hypothetical protein